MVMDIIPWEMIRGTVLLAGQNPSGTPRFINDTILGAALDSDGNPRPLLVDADGNLLVSGGGAPSGAAGGDLTGTYPDPTIANNKVTTAKILDANVTSRKIDLNQSDQAVATSQTTTSTSYTDLSTVGPAITLSPGVTQNHFITVYAEIENSGAGNRGYMSVAIAGAAATDANGLMMQSATAGNNQCGGAKSTVSTGQATGATHTSKYRASAGTATFSNRRIIGIAI